MSLNLRTLRQIISSEKVVDSKLLNVLGVQVQRTLAAHVMYNLRRVAVDAAVHDKVQELREEGITLWRDFLPAEHFAQLQREYLPLLDVGTARVKTVQHGPNTYDIAVLRDFDPAALPYTYKLFTEPRLQALLEAAEKRRLHYFSGHRAFERLTQGPVGALEDPEARLHSDTFFTNHKAWLYLSDVEPDNGPFVYVKRSHRLSFTKLYYIYHESCTRNAGSRRITHAELERLSLQETIVTCPKNTLVIANVAGFHRRLRGRPGRRRYAVHISLRTNPFAWWRSRVPGLE